MLTEIDSSNIKPVVPLLLLLPLSDKKSNDIRLSNKDSRSLSDPLDKLMMKE